MGLGTRGSPQDLYTLPLMLLGHVMPEIGGNNGI